MKTNISYALQFVLKENGVVFESLDALFGLPRKKSSGVSLLPPERSGLPFADQQIVDNFVNNYQDKSSDSVCSQLHFFLVIMLKFPPNLFHHV